jgi:hypothetical protein
MDGCGCVLTIQIFMSWVGLDSFFLLVGAVNVIAGVIVLAANAAAAAAAAAVVIAAVVSTAIAVAHVT